MSELPKIFVFCNSCAPQWHSMLALAEDGTALAGHLCSDHGFASHDMGIHENGWKRDLYEAHYPDGFEVVWVEDFHAHEGLQKAAALNTAKGEEAKAALPERSGDEI